MSKQSLGRWGEHVAEVYLDKKGYEFIARNVRSSYGEIDLVARQGDEIVFIEVKTRTNRAYGMPEEAVTPLKLSHLEACIQDWIQNHPEHSQMQYRIDVIAIQLSRGGRSPQIEHFENVVR
ncbi:MAG TPA: YraN family protein [Anaerolineaceae bacterium]